MPVFVLIPAALVGYKLWQKRMQNRENNNNNFCCTADEQDIDATQDDDDNTQDAANDQEYEVIAATEEESNTSKSVVDLAFRKSGPPPAPIAQVSSVSDDTTATTLLEFPDNIEITDEALFLESLDPAPLANERPESCQEGDQVEVEAGKCHSDTTFVLPLTQKFTESDEPHNDSASETGDLAEEVEKRSLGQNQILLTCSIDEPVQVPAEHDNPAGSPTTSAVEMRLDDTPTEKKETKGPTTSNGDGGDSSQTTESERRACSTPKLQQPGQQQQQHQPRRMSPLKRFVSRHLSKKEHSSRSLNKQIPVPKISFK
ncbi:hypothetical protein ACA910_014592 [Epithemia clementina (nom. ined.)]